MEETKKPTKYQRMGYGPVAAVLVTIGVYFASQFVVGLLAATVPFFTGWSLEYLQTWLTESPVAQFLTIVLVEAVTLWLVWLFLKGRKVALKTIG